MLHFLLQTAEHMATDTGEGNPAAGDRVDFDTFREALRDGLKPDGYVAATIVADPEANTLDVHGYMMSSIRAVFERESDFSFEVPRERHAAALLRHLLRGSSLPIYGGFVLEQSEAGFRVVQVRLTPTVMLRMEVMRFTFTHKALTQ